MEKSGDTEVTKIARRSQTAKRALPKALRERQVRAQSARHKAGRSLPGPTASVPEPPRRCASNIGAGSSRARSCPGSSSVRTSPAGAHRAVGESDQAPAAVQALGAYRYVPKKSRAVRL